VAQASSLAVSLGLGLFPGRQDACLTTLQMFDSISAPIPPLTLIHAKDFQRKAAKWQRRRFEKPLPRSWTLPFGERRPPSAPFKFLP
jgi:hypothetical protein